MCVCMCACVRICMCVCAPHLTSFQSIQLYLLHLIKRLAFVGAQVGTVASACAVRRASTCCRGVSLSPLRVGAAGSSRCISSQGLHLAWSPLSHWQVRLEAGTSLPRNSFLTTQPKASCILLLPRIDPKSYGLMVSLTRKPSSMKAETRLSGPHRVPSSQHRTHIFQETMIE